MNFLDAHKIVFDYIDVIANTKEIPFHGIGELKNSIDEILDAYKLFIAHMFAFSTYSEEEYEKFNICIFLLRTFGDDNLVEQLKECQVILDDKSFWGRIKNKSAIPFAKEKSSRLLQEIDSSYYDDEKRKEMDLYLEAIVQESENFRNQYLQLYNNEYQNLQKRLLLINNYCQKVYQIANIPMDNDDMEYFYPFSFLKECARNKNLEDLFEPYKAYIFENER